MPVEEWSNEGQRMDLRLVLGKQLRMPVYLEGDHTAAIFTGKWEMINDEGTMQFAIEQGVLEAPEGEEGIWTKILVKFDAQPQKEGPMYRYKIEQDGGPLLYGRMKMVADV